MVVLAILVQVDILVHVKFLAKIVIFTSFALLLSCTACDS